MPTNVYYNIAGHRIIDNERVVEDVTSVALPTISHPTISIQKVSGLAADIDIPDRTHLDAMEFGVSHNNGINCQYLNEPVTHFFEVRVARQKYNVGREYVEHQPDKFRVKCLPKSTDKGSVEMGNPYGSTVKYSVLRYEEELNGEIITIIDSTAGIVRFNGKDYYDDIEKLLS